MPTRISTARQHVIFLDELHRYSDREVCFGAAECAAARPAWGFDPWPITFATGGTPAWADLKMVGGILTTEHAMQQMAGLRRRLKIPVVYCLADQAHRDADAVGIDEQAVGQMAAEHLWNRGYRHFAFIGSSDTGWSNGRAKGFSRWLADAGVAPTSHLFTQEEMPVFWSWNLARRNRRLLDALSQLPRPCGIFAANDVIASFVLQTARDSHRRVPEEIGVVGVDNDPFPNAAARLAISSIELPFREVGRRAALFLQDRWNGVKAGRLVRLPPIRVVVRASTDTFMTNHALVRKAQAYIESRRHERVTVADVTRAVGSNRVTLGKHFHLELDTTLLDYLRRRRLAYAVEQLRAGGTTVDEVALQCGYSSPSYFSRVFKAHTGSRPGAVRRGGS